MLRFILNLIGLVMSQLNAWTHRLVTGQRFQPAYQVVRVEEPNRPQRRL